MSVLSSAIEGGKSPRDAVADLLKGAVNGIFNGDGYSEEWQTEAASLGLPNLKNTVAAVEHLTSQKNVDVLGKHKVLAKHEVEARQAIQYEAYANIVTIEATVMVKMMDTGVIPACAEDLQKYQGPAAALDGGRGALYAKLAEETDKLRSLVAEAGGDGHGFDDEAAAAKFAYEKLTTQMAAVREVHDQVEGKLDAGLYPYPTYQELLYSHHSLPA